MSEERSRSVHLVPLVATQAVGLLCGLVGVRWSSAIVPPEVLGTFGLLVATHLFGVSVTHQGFVKHVQRFWTSESAARPYLRRLLGAATQPTLWLAVGLVGVLLMLKLTAGTTIAVGWWAWMMAVNVMVILANLVHAALQAEERYWAHFAVSAVGAATRSFIPLLLVTAGGAPLLMLGQGFAAHTLLWLLAGAWFLRGAWRRSEVSTGEEIEAPQRLIGVFIWIGLCSWFAANSPRWLAAVALTPETTGYFMLAMNLSMIVPAAVSMTGQSYSFPALFAATRNGASDATLLGMTNRTVVLALLAGQSGLLVLAWCGPRLIGILVDSRYSSSMEWLLAAGGGTLATVTCPFFCNLLIARNREQECLWLTGISAAVRISVIAGLAWVGNVEMFRTGLTVLAWPTAVLEWWLVCRWLARPPNK
ncbi:MAG: hypothetical protein EXS37_00555 [Opitutus sp.]|nr:hypothetical protein [Opitutus sp.]